MGYRRRRRCGLSKRRRRICGCYHKPMCATHKHYKHYYHHHHITKHHTHCDDSNYGSHCGSMPQHY